MGNIILILILGGIIFLIWYLRKIGYKLDDATIGVDNPYYDNKVNSMPLDKYEKELDKAFTNTFKEKKTVLNDDDISNINISEEDVDAIIDDNDFTKDNFRD